MQLFKARSTSGMKKSASFQTINLKFRFNKLAAKTLLSATTQNKHNWSKKTMVITYNFTKCIAFAFMENVTAENDDRPVVESCDATDNLPTNKEPIFSREFC